MTLRPAILVAALTLPPAAASAQTIAAPPPHPLSVAALGGLSVGNDDAGGSFGAAIAFDVTDRIAVEARGLQSDRGSGERGLEMSGAMRITLARTARAMPYATLGGGMYRASFDLGDDRFFGMMNGQYPAGTPFVPMHGNQSFAMMGPAATYHGTMWTGPWTGPTFTASRMPMFYANRMGEMAVPMDGRWGMRSFIDPALTFGGGLHVAVTRRLYVVPDLRGVVVMSGGDHMTFMTMNIGFGVRF